MKITMIITTSIDTGFILTHFDGFLGNFPSSISSLSPYLHGDFLILNNSIIIISHVSIYQLSSIITMILGWTSPSGRHFCPSAWVCGWLEWLEWFLEEGIGIMTIFSNFLDVVPIWMEVKRLVYVINQELEYVSDLPLATVLILGECIIILVDKIWYISGTRTTISN